MRINLNGLSMNYSKNEVEWCCGNISITMLDLSWFYYTRQHELRFHWISVHIHSVSCLSLGRECLLSLWNNTLRFILNCSLDMFFLIYPSSFQYFSLAFYCFSESLNRNEVSRELERLKLFNKHFPYIYCQMTPQHSPPFHHIRLIRMTKSLNCPIIMKMDFDVEQLFCLTIC